MWEPLLVVAHLAGSDWPALGRAACIAFVTEAGEDDTETSPGQLLLGDIQAVMNTSFMPSADLCAALNNLPESPWGGIPLNPHKLGQQLKPYSIRTRHTADKSRRGYHRVDFEDAWRRYLLEEPSETVQSVPQMDGQRDASTTDAPAKSLNPSGQNDVTAYTPDSSDALGQAAPDNTESLDAERCPDCGTVNAISNRVTGKCVYCIVSHHTAKSREVVSAV
ncbi:hypothetical protein A5714_03345 [Mycobacterium sp. E2462]|nr:hypothetical protein A5714_03345 [Mycobacterium sp. E2462]